ncbi:hypothetical protein OG871_10865 [Kitasatospora sp. NBC_00374]|uniref:hypothetical protein n=1 Tax=Kitasatospora sp. NBC_00374 TaxID=2975964 RepID=UPI0030E2AE31
MIEGDVEQPAPARRGWLRPAALVAVGVLGAAGLAGWALTGSDPAPARTPAVAPATPGLSAGPSASPSPSPSAAAATGPSDQPSTGPSAEPSTPANSGPTAVPSARPATKAAAPTRRATATPRSEISPRTDDCGCDHRPAPVNPDCQRDPAGNVMTCGPVLTPTPPPNPAASPKQYTGPPAPPN